MTQGLGAAFLVLVFVGCNGTNSSSSGGNPPPSDMTLLAADRNGELYTIDPATGTETLLLDTFASDGMGGTRDVGVISSMVYVPGTGRLLAGGGGKSFCPRCTLSINLLTGEVTSVHDNSTVANSLAGMAIRPSDGAVFATAGDGDGLLRLDAMTGIASDAGSFGTGTRAGNALAVTMNGDLLLAADQSLYVVDTATGHATPLAVMTFSGFSTFTGGQVSVVSMATAADGTIYGIVQDGGGTAGGLNGAAAYLATVDPMTGVVTHVGQFMHQLDGLVFVPSSILP